MIEELSANASLIVERELDGFAKKLEERLDADVLSYIGPIYYGIDDLIRDAVEHRAQNRDHDNLAVILETTGGYIEVVQRVADLLRHHYERVEFVIPNHAMSAGTVLVMSGDAIHMDYYSVLGPIDPQIERNIDGERHPIPATGYLRRYEQLVEKSESGDLGNAELLYLLEKFDPGEMYDFEHARLLSISLLKGWLTKYKFKNWNFTETSKKPVTPQMKADRAEKVAETLSDTDRWHSHGRGISMEVLRNVCELKIDDFGVDEELSTGIRAYHKLLVDYQLVRGVYGFGVVHTHGRYQPVGG